MKISITCVANGNNKQSLLVWTIRRKYARASNKSLEWWLRLKTLALSWGDGGVLSSQAEEAERQTVVWLFPGKSGCFNHLRALSHRCAHCCAWPKPASRRARTRCVTKERITASNMEGKKRKTGKEARNLQSDTLSKLLVGMLVTPPALGNQLSLAVGLLRRLLKPFHLKIFGRDFCLSREDVFTQIRFQQGKESLREEKTQAKPHRLSSWLPKRVLKELALWVRGTPRSTPWS